MVFICACGTSPYYKKPAIIASNIEGTFFDVHLLLYPDSTFYYSNSNKDPTGEWTQNGDTYSLIKEIPLKQL